MSDVSGNNEIIEDPEELTGETEETSEGETVQNEETQSEVVYTDSSDYSAYLENIQNCTFFISALLYALILIVAFVGGVQNGKR